MGSFVRNLGVWAIIALLSAGLLGLFQLRSGSLDLGRPLGYRDRVF